MRSRFALSTAIAAAFLVTAGCASSIAGSGSPGQAAGRTTATPTASAAAPTASPTGSTGQSTALRTADPCSFLTKSTFNGLGRNATVTVTSADYSSCYFSVTVPASAGVRAWSVDLTMSGSYTSGQDFQTVYSITPAERQVNGTTVFSGSSATIGCLDAFNLADGTTVVIVAKANGKPADSCLAATPAFQTAMANYQNGRLVRLPLPANSIAALDPCATMAASGTAWTGGVPGKRSGEHTCSWATKQTSAAITMESTPWPPRFLSGGKAGSTMLDGHDILYSGATLENRTLVNAFVDFGPAPVGGTGSHDAMSISLFESQTGSAPNMLSSFLGPSIANLPR